MCLKSGVTLTGAQHLTFLAACAEGITKSVPVWNLTEVAIRDTGRWIWQHLNEPVNTRLLIKSIEAGESFGASGKLSLAQWCKAV